MVVNKISKIKHNDRTIPMVMFNNCSELEMLIRDWLGNERTVSEYAGLMLLKLGILVDQNDFVQVYNFDIKTCSFDCIVNDKDIYKIEFKNLNLVGFNTEIVVSFCNVKDIFECIPVRDIELGMRIIHKIHSIYEKGACFTRYLSMDNVIFTINKQGYALELGVNKPNDVVLSLFDDDGNYSKYTLDNEEKLIDYLTQLDFPVSIVDVYKDVCSISLGNIEKYPRMVIKVLRGIFNNKRVTDLIHLENGCLERFGMTVDGTNRVIFLDKDNNWSYEDYEDNSFVKISSDIEENKINYNISIDNCSNAFNIQHLLNSSMKCARKDIEDVKVRVRSLFDETKFNCLKNMDSN